MTPDTPEITLKIPVLEYGPIATAAALSGKDIARWIRAPFSPVALPTGAKPAPAPAPEPEPVEPRVATEEECAALLARLSH